MVFCDFVVIGGGVIGCAVASKLKQKFKNATIVLLEKQKLLGQETSSRNSQVIHAGLYYPADSLKLQTCIIGKNLLYEYCQTNNISFRKVGKLVIADDSDQQKMYIENLHFKARNAGVETEILTGEQVKKMEPGVMASMALFSPTTGIFDSHAFIDSLAQKFEDLGGLICYSHHVTNITKCENIFRISVKTPMENLSLSSTNVINCAGLYACEIANMMSSTKIQYSFVKGHYMKWKNHQHALNHLVYPVADKNVYSLGIHATLDLAGNIRFGPDVLPVDDITYSMPNIIPPHFYNSISKYIANFQAKDLEFDYCGIRPKLSTDKFSDFEIRESTKNFVDCLGLESPGLTSSLSLADIIANKF